MIGSYVSRVEEACGSAKTKDYTVILKFNNREEAIRKALQRSTILREVRGMVAKASYDGKEFTVFMNGRIIFKSLKDRGELNSILENLLK